MLLPCYYVECDAGCGEFDGLRRSIIRSLRDMLDLSNTYVSSLKMAKDILESRSDEYKVVIHPDRKLSQEHSRRFNAPSCNEVAVLLLDEEHGKRDIVLRYRDATLQRISKTHRSYDALQYPLLFPRGENGYNFATTTVVSRIQTVGRSNARSTYGRSHPSERAYSQKRAVARANISRDVRRNFIAINYAV